MGFATSELWIKGRTMPYKRVAGACPQCGKVPVEGFSRKIVGGVDKGPQVQCDSCRRHLSERRKKQRVTVVLEEWQCTSCKKAKDDPTKKTCSKCRAASRAKNAKPHTIAAKKNYDARESSKRKKAAREKTPQRKAKKMEWHDSERGRAMTSASNRQRYQRVKDDPAWALDHKLCTLLRFTLTEGLDSGTVREMTEFKSPEEFLDHMKSLFTDGMTETNHGRGKDCWHIGHRIPRAKYDHADPSEVRKCWSKLNIFPQWEVDNLSQGSRLPPRDELVALRSIWPKSWAS
tara:strand:+ start:49 stop:915 length:867 start_codon:yes stop_codon:yes gene_type:complete